VVVDDDLVVQGHPVNTRRNNATFAAVLALLDALGSN